MRIEEIDFRDAQMLRRKAEEVLKEKQLAESIAQQEADREKLLHELQVHQIELEMQNEELRNAYETSELALKRYTMVFDLSLVGYFTLNEEGKIYNLNFTGADMLGERRFGLVNSNFKLFVSGESKSVFNNFLSNLYASYKKESCEVLLVTDKKALYPVYMEGVVNEDDQKCLLSVIDLSKFRKMDI